jgi:hypothetical protein
MEFPICYGSPGDVFAVSSCIVHFYTLHFKEKEEKAAAVSKANVYTLEKKRKDCVKGNCTQAG